MFLKSSFKQLYPQFKVQSYLIQSLLFLILGLEPYLVFGQGLRLNFDPVYSPPSVIPTDPNKLVYSVPLNQMISEPIIVNIVDASGNRVAKFNETIEATITSMDMSQKSKSDPDSWRDSGGIICQWSNPTVRYPDRLDRKLYFTRCGNSTSLRQPFLMGELIVDWLFHVHMNGTLPKAKRFLRIEVPDLNLSEDTNLFQITEPAARLVLVKGPPQNITANTPFNMSVEIHNSNGIPVVEGLDSVAYVELTVAYYHKVFYNVIGREMMLKSTKTRLAGRYITPDESSRDLVIRKRAIKGKAFFNDVRLLDFIYDLYLNFTMYMSKDPFLRIPNCKLCYLDTTKVKVLKDTFIFPQLPSSIMAKVPSIVITQPMDVLSQELAELKYINRFKGKGKLSITRNFPIPVPLIIETLDKNGNRIYSGSDSDLPLEVKAIPSDVCLSSDYSVLSFEGIATFVGSICDIRPSVYLIFYSKKNPNLNVTSHELVVRGDIPIVHFDNFYFAGGARDISPHVNSFIRFAANDVNSGRIPGILKQFNMKLFVITVETKNDISNTILQYRLLQEEAALNPANSIRAAILSGNPMISATITRELFTQDITQISLDDEEDKQSHFALFNRVCWNGKQIYGSFFNFAYSRRWMRMIVLRTSNSFISPVFFNMAREKKIHLQELKFSANSIEWKNEYIDGNKKLSSWLSSLKVLNVKTIVCFANGTQIPHILYNAKLQAITPKEGYQWVFVSSYAMQFPMKNSWSCSFRPSCTVLFSGTILFTETYNTSFMHTKDWERVLEYYFSTDKSIYLGLKSVYPNIYMAAKMALGYDATWLLAKAIANIVSKSLTATTERITEELRKVKIQGLSGTVQLDNYGNRHGFSANIQVINASQEDDPSKEVAPLYKYIKTDDKGMNVEYLYGTETDRNTIETPHVPIPLASVYHNISVPSRTGRVSKTDLRLMEYTGEKWPSANIVRTEKSVPSYTCSIPCGKQTDKSDVNLYSGGICSAMNVCTCFPLFSGTHCGFMFCNCSNGFCKKPDTCICNKGYKGKTCDVPICRFSCKFGNCVAPDTCRCISYAYAGSQCQIQLTSALIPGIILGFLALHFIQTSVVFLRKHTRRKAALSNVDWLVEWQDVKHFEKSLTNTGMYSSTTTGQVGLCTWKKKKWYIKAIDSNSIDQENVIMHLEMVELVSIQHQNLITYGGACLVSPNVCFLVEPTHKGSLEDVLLSETTQLDWNFRFSFMNDICRGMEYLHEKTSIKSHGRLKSSNCLLDSRWCVRISDFGASKIRYGPYRVKKTEEELDADITTLEALLWTAPELLATAQCIDNVQMGTQEGDVYSFGILVTEIATRDIPFMYERTFLPTCAIIDLIVDKNDPSIVEERGIWDSLQTGMEHVRPFMGQEYLPSGLTAQENFKKMLNEVWCEDPTSRITFQKLKTVLDKIFPSKKELMDNLMYLLESYSKDLEKKVEEKTKEVDVEKMKIENIISQLLPKNVIAELRKGKKVEPELFDSVTVYYSEICEFTTIAMKCQPMQVVDLLNELYNMIDDILEKYDVYKVETISDAYVVASGVPTNNGKLHASEIANASLDIMSSLMSLNVTHITKSKLRMRLGIHTGPVVAGVVGLKMPRYTLFGETMRIAALMESTSKPMHIQVSETTVALLHDIGDFHLQYRHRVDIAGRSLDTYYLSGKRQYNKPLPICRQDSKMYPTRF